MTNHTLALSCGAVSGAAAGRRRTVGLFRRLGKNASLLLIAAMFLGGTGLSLCFGIPVKRVMSGYSYDVLVILIVMELFNNLSAGTGIMQLRAIRIAQFSQGKKRLCLILFGAMMFLISSCLNNISALLMLLPIVFVLLKTIEVDRRYTCTFFAVILALSSTGGAASPVGDFPAIVILTSGITDFVGYLTHAFPLFALTSAVLLLVWGLYVREKRDDGAVRGLAISNLKSQYRNIEVRFDVLKWLAVVFLGMFLAWSFVPQETLPPEIIAVLGYAVALVVCSVKKVRVEQRMDLKSVLTIASFLFFAQVVSQTGLLERAADALQRGIHDPKLLVMAIMVITSLVAGVFSAGPAAAAMMPVIVELCAGPLSAQSHWIAVAYAAAICSGSSLFMWSATAGFVLSEKVNAAGLEDETGRRMLWGVGQYLKYGLVTYAIQLSIALTAMALVL